MSVVEVNKALARRLFEEDLNEEDQIARSGAADQLVAPDVVDHTNPPELKYGLESHKQIVTILHTAFPNVRWEVEDLIAEGDKVVARTTMHATHTGVFFGIPPTGKQVTVLGIQIMRFADGKLAEHWGNNDDLGMMQQLGVVPTMV